MAFECAPLLVHHVEVGVHGLVVADALGVAAAYYAMQLVGDDHLFLLHHVEVVYDVEHHVGCHYREAAYLLVREVLVGHLDDALLSQLVAVQVVSDGS